MNPMYLDKGGRIVLDRKFPYVVELPRHPDHPRDKLNGDPRKEWLYSGVASGKWMVDPDPLAKYGIIGELRTYRFANEYDAVMFRLKWA